MRVLIATDELEVPKERLLRRHCTDDVDPSTCVVMRWRSARKRAQPTSADLAAAGHDSQEAEYRECRGGVEGAVLARARSWAADVVVLAPADPSDRRWLHTAAALARELPCSVRLSRHRRAGLPRRPRIVVGIDGSSGAEGAMVAASTRRWPDGTSALVVHVVDPGTDADEPVASSRLTGVLSSYADRLRGSGVPTIPLVVAGDPARQLVEEAVRWEAGTILVGARGLDSRGGSGIGSVAEAVLRAAECSVEVVRCHLAAALLPSTARFETRRALP